MASRIQHRRHVGEASELVAHVALIRITRRKRNVSQRCRWPLNKPGSMVKPRDRGEKLGGNTHGFEKHALKLAAAFAECGGSLIDPDRAVGRLNQCDDIIDPG